MRARRDPRLALARGRTRTQALSEAPGMRTAAGLVADKRELEARLKGLTRQLADLAEEPDVTDLLINDPDHVWVDRGHGLERCDLHVEGPAGLRALAVGLAAAAGVRLDDACPIADGTLPSGIRLHAVLPPLSSGFPLVSLRIPRASALSVADLTAAGTITPGLARVLTALVARRASTFISGATGSGKTTLLAALLAEISHTHRLIIIEEVTELQPRHPHVVHLQERRGNVEGAGTVSMSDLLRAAMRMRPDRLILGECRGAEVREVLAAMNTGHEGGWATIHANTPKDVPARLVALGALAGLDEPTIAAQAKAGIDAFVHIRRSQPGPHGRAHRWVSDIAVPNMCRGHLEARTAISVSADGRLETGPGWAALAARLDLDPGSLP